MGRFVKNNWIILLILLFAISIRFWRLDQPPTYYFDEVYNAFTAQALARNDPKGYEWWHTAPAGFAYEWTNPPLGRLMGTVGILIFGDNTFGWRFFPAFFGAAFTLLFYYSGSIFFNKRVGVLAATLYALETLVLVHSRTLHPDIFFVFFLFAAFFLSFLFLKNPKSLKLLILTGAVFGLSAATRISSFWGIAAACILFLFYFIFIKRKLFQAFLYPTILGITALVTYFLSFTQFFLQGHTFGQLVELHKQIWFFQTGLTATHPFSSNWYEWILGRGAIWYWTEQQNGLVGNIWAVGNPLIFIFGAVAIGFLIFRFFETKKLQFGIILLGYFSFLLPWIFVSRLTFLYHYLPPLSFAILAQAVFLGNIWEIQKFGKFLVILIIILAFAVFAYFFPHVTGIYLPEAQAKVFNDLMFKLR